MIKIALISITILLFSCVNKGYQSLIKEADDKYSNGYYKKAYKLYSKAAKRNKKELYPLVKKAETFYLGKKINNKNRFRTQKLYNDCFDLVNNSKDAFMSRSIFFKYYDLYALAIKDADSLESKYGANYDAKVLRAQIFYQVGNTEKADVEMEKAINISAEKWSAYYEKGQMEFNSGLYEKAKNDLVISYKQCPDKLKFRGVYSLIISYSKLDMADSACFYYKAYRHILKDFDKWQPDIVSKCKN